MVNQGLWGAIEQFWTVEEKPRLNRRNSYFEDHLRFSSIDVLYIYLLVLTVGITIVMLMIIGVMI